MTRTIQQSVKFKAAPRELFELYIDSKKHSTATKAPARISRKTGGRFSARGGMVFGRNLVIIPNRMIVQAWRAKPWRASDPDSILVLTFQDVAGGAQVNLIHVNVPPYDLAGVTEGWKKYYWKPWREYLTQQRKKG
jgi:activator of HSP90 ATPase